MKKHFRLPNTVATVLCLGLFVLGILFLAIGCASKTDPSPTPAPVYSGKLRAMNAGRDVYRYTDEYGVTCYIFSGYKAGGISCNFPKNPDRLTDAEFLVLTSEVR